MQAKLLNEILLLDCADFGVEFYTYLSNKGITGQPLHPLEEMSFLLLSMLLDIEMEGFVDLFYQQYTLHKCSIVEHGLRTLQLHTLADLFVEAKQIYTNGRAEITQEEYQAIEPFDDDEKWQQFDEIGTLMLAEGSEIYLIGQRIYNYMKEHKDILLAPQS